MNSKEAAEILLSYKAGTATEEEKAWVESWYMRFKDRAAAVPGDQIAEDQAESWARFEEAYAAMAGDRPAKIRVRRLWPRVAVAAAAVAAIVFGIWFFNAPRIDTPSSRTTGRDLFANDIAPGKNTATLTLANGKKIKLNDAVNGELAREAGVIITKTEDGALVYEILSNSEETIKMNTLSTAMGESYQLRLPDGSMVWLNAATTLKYPTNFSKLENRKVTLTGEAYFEVFKDKKRPFVVATDKQEVQVLGTHFNINSYADESSVKTTLLEGSVRVSLLTGRAGEVLLKPNEQAVNTGAVIDVTQVEAADAIAWKNGEFLFDEEPLESIMRKIARWYNVEVVYKDIRRSKRFGGTVSKFGNVSDVLKMLELTGEVHFKIEGRVITVMP